MPDHHDPQFTTANFFDNFTRNVKATELWRIYDKTDANSLRLFLSNIKEGTVLDFGCGDGRNIPLIVNNSQQFWVGIDISKVRIQQANAKIGGISNLYAIDVIGEKNIKFCAKTNSISLLRDHIQPRQLWAGTA